MRNPMERLILSVAEFLDRNLIMVPDVDMTMAATAGSATALSTERQIPRTLNADNKACRNAIEHHCFGSMGVVGGASRFFAASRYYVVAASGNARGAPASTSSDDETARNAADQ
jgi:hypothetical protein